MYNANASYPRYVSLRMLTFFSRVYLLNIHPAFATLLNYVVLYVCTSMRIVSLLKDQCWSERTETVFFYDLETVLPNDFLLRSPAIFRVSTNIATFKTFHYLRRFL